MNFAPRTFNRPSFLLFLIAVVSHFDKAPPAMQFELTKEYIDQLKAAIAAHNDAVIATQLSELHPADIAELFDRLDSEETTYLYHILDEETASEVLVELEEDVREKLLEGFSSKEIAEALEEVDSDDAADVISELPEEQVEEVLGHIEDAEQVSDIVDLLTYEEGTAGALMAKEMVVVQSDWTVSRAIIEMRKQSEQVENVYSVYVIDKEGRLEGILPLKKLLFSAESTRTLIKHLSDTDVISTTADTEEEDVVKKIEKYDLVSIPVVDEHMHLIGRITIDDVVDVMKEEAEKDYQMASGISQPVESRDKVMALTRARLPWLLIGLLGGVLVALVISQYEETLKIDPKLAFFIPLIAAMGGNVGVQSSAIIVQGLANRSLALTSIFGRLTKEFMVGLLNGTICAVLIFFYNIFFGASYPLSYTVSIALFAVIIFAALLGTFIPLVLDKFKIDPALATGPFITTLNDIVGLVVYFTVGHLFYDIPF